MGNTCSCSEETHNKELSFKGASSEYKKGTKGGNYGEGSVHEYSSNPNMYGRNGQHQPSFAGNKDPNKHEPPAHIATPVTVMNPISSMATNAITRLPRFTPTNKSQNPEFGPLKYKENGETYKGQYHQGLRNGFGEMTTSSGEGYIGEWRNDVKHGRGRLVFANGDLYEGEFKNGIAEGKGKFYNKETGSVYDGYFKNNKQNGKGKEVFRDGAQYEGDFIDDKKTGNGLFVFADGSRYTGMFKDDEIEGKGKHSISNIC